jgi:hypothetical protein
MYSKSSHPTLPVHLDQTSFLSSSSESLPPGTDSHTHSHHIRGKTDYEKFIEEAARSTNSKRAKWQIEVPPLPSHPSISTPVFQRRVKRSKALQLSTAVVLIASIASTVTAALFLIQDIHHFGPRGWHIIMLIISTGFSFASTTLPILIQWHQQDLQKAREELVLEKTVDEAAAQARSEKGIAMLEVISTSDR